MHAHAAGPERSRVFGSHGARQERLVTLVVGASGLLGGKVARRLIDSGRPVRILVRRPLAMAGAESVTGDLKDPASLDAACRGVTAVVTTANSAQRGGEDTVASVDLAGNRALIDAARRNGVRQFVFVSAAFVEESSPVPFLAAKASTERHLRESGMGWTIVAPHVFLDVWFGLLVGSAVAAGMPVSLVNGGTRRHSLIAVDDVAEFAARAVGHPAAMNRQFVLGGPEALSWSDVVAATSAILGRTVPVQSIEPGQPIPSLPAPADRMAGGLAASLEQQDVVIDAAEAARLLGVTLTPAETVLRRLLMEK
jgi:NADH dehydrogenase